MVLDAITVVATLVWAGGLIALGAIVAPTVFGSGNPHAADVMTVIFARFDRLAICAALLVVLAQGATLLSSRVLTRRAQIIRAILAAVFVLCVVLQAGYLTPTIVSLHAQGIRRGVGSGGQWFNAVHRYSEMVGKVGVFSALALALTVLKSR